MIITFFESWTIEELAMLYENKKIAVTLVGGHADSIKREREDVQND